MSNYMKDPEYLFSVLAVIVKKNGGILKLTEEEISAVSKNDMIGMYYEPETNSIIFKEVSPADAIQASNIIKERKSDLDKYEN
tara:strand:+ start:1791 stop:2039 length:249 start_codon:yes stop_codon:yes gene_type:complete